ncbi:hypothetical protein J2Z44_004178 [Clostridium punense]|uniref:DUF304 domain-containing protein n=1 Tax=Clostridium punense TaxID=1054297 RepID=A0ABS4K951_9CLOT|nr:MULTISPECIES: hypothetical protein [Clostridium]EQB89762.1 hypothetical protein M918_19130 [Clostridium sp. BL8]MBP2024318.1 hypothetical protein [Clostridium punense]
MSKASVSLNYNSEKKKDLYGKKPDIGKNGEMIFKKDRFIRFVGVIFTTIAILNIAFDFIFKYVLKEDVADNSIDKWGYMWLDLLIIALLLIGIGALIIFHTHKIIVSQDNITSKKVFSSKTINLHEIESVKFSSTYHLIFISSNCKIKFGIFTTGLVAMLKFVEKNIPQHKCEDAVAMTKKLLRGVNYIPKGYGRL